MMKQGTYNVNFFFPQDIKRSIAEQLIDNKELIIRVLDKLIRKFDFDI